MDTVLDSQDRLDILQTGEHCVVRFDGTIRAIDTLIVARRDELMSLIEEHQPKTLTLDLTNLKAISSASLGVLFGVHKQGVQVQVYHPSEPIREVLLITQLNEIFAEVDNLPLEK